MKTSLRISLILSVLSTITIIIVTVLMHFRYHITRSNLINDRIGVTGSSIYAVIDNNLRTGISIDSQSDIVDYIKRSKKHEDIIEQIYILKNVNWNLETVFKTSEEDIPSTVNTRATQKMKSSKVINWSLSDTHDSESTTMWDLQ